MCQAFGLPKRTVAAEVDLDLLIARAVHLRTAPTFSSYPVAKEDVAPGHREDRGSGECH